MTVRLRSHHLLCMLTFVGKGYTEAFTRNYVSIAKRLSAGEDILIVDGPDDICRPMLDDATCHCRNAGIDDRDRLAAEAVGALLGRSVASGAVIAPDGPMLNRMRLAFASGTLRAGCAACEWTDLCSGIAASGFEGVLVKT